MVPPGSEVPVEAWADGYSAPDGDQDRSVAAWAQEAQVVTTGQQFDRQAGVFGIATQLVSGHQSDTVATNPSTRRLTLETLLEERGEHDGGACGVVLRRSGLGDDGTGRRVHPWPLEADPTVESSQVIRIGQPYVDDGQTARCQMFGQRPHRRLLGRTGCQDQERIERDEGQTVGPGVGQGQPDDIGLDQGQPVGRRAPLRSRSCPIKHGRIEIDTGHRVAGLSQRDRQSTGADGKFEDRPVDPVCKREIEVEVVGVVDQIEIVQARQRAGGRRIRAPEIGRVDDQASQRTRPPAWRLTASALIASRAARFAALAVVSAWS